MFLGKGGFADAKKKQQWFTKRQKKGYAGQFQSNVDRDQVDPTIAKKMRTQVKNAMNGQNSMSKFVGDDSIIELNLGTKSGQKFFASNEVTMFGWNVNGVRALIKKKKLEEFLNTINPDILCLGETKIDEEALKVEKLERHIPKEYLQYWNCCVPPIKGKFYICNTNYRICGNSNFHKNHTIVSEI